MLLIRKSPHFTLHIFCFASLLFMNSCKTSQPSGATFEKQLDAIFSAVPDYSGVLLVADRGRPVYHKAFGYKNFETKEPMSTSAIVEIASVSKQFTTMTIMQMSEAGKLTFDDPIEKYIPGLPYPGVTIRHLLHHTSGLPDYQQVMDEHWDKTKVAGNADNIAYLIRYHPAALFAPGEKYEYSNTGYMLLASITEKVSGEDFIEYCRKHFFRPYGMTKTDIRTNAQKKELADLALGHIYVKEKQRYVPADSFPQFNYAIWLGDRKGPGRVSSTSEDLLKRDRALYKNELVKPETLQEAFSPAKLNDGTLSHYGFGWRLEYHDKLGKIVRHSGDNPGYRTQYIRYIDADKTVVLFCNNDHEKLKEIVAQIEATVGKHYSE
jgi:CubicO group peptidase (beta-lactamase class C family)